MQHLSLKTKMSVAVSLLFVLFIAGMSLFILSYLGSRFEKTIADQQYTHISSLARSIDNNIGMAKSALLGASSMITPEITANPAAARAYLNNRPTLLSLFDDGTYMFGRDGNFVADDARRIRPFTADTTSYFRYYCWLTLETGKPCIADKYIPFHTQDNPAIFIVVPLFDRHGNFFGALGGSINLNGKSLLEEITSIRIGDSGYLYLCDTNQTIIAHPVKSRILEKIAPQSGRELFDKAMKGFEGSGITENSKGVRMLTSFKHINSNNWVIVANLPVDEAYAPIRTTRYLIILATAAGMAISLLLVWQLMNRLTSPLLQFTAHVKALPEKQGDERVIHLATGDEIEYLAECLNGMIGTLDTRQQAIGDSENNFRALAETASDGMLVLDASGNIVYANYRMAQMTGRNTASLLSGNVRELVPPQQLPPVLERLRKVVTQEEVPGYLETSLNHVNGLTLEVEITSAITYWQGAPADLMVVRDITERKKVEAALLHAVTRAENEKARSEAIIAAIGEALSIQDRDFRIFFQNQAHEDWVGNHLGEQCFHAYEHRTEPCVNCPIALSFQDGLIHTVEKTSHYEGKEAVLEITASPLRNASGEIIAGIEIVRDITARKRSETEIKALSRDLELRVEELALVNRELESFSYSLSHDLKTPLTGIYAAAQALEEEVAGSLTETGRFILGTIGQSCERMEEIIDAMLLLGMVGRSDLELAQFDLSSLAREILLRLEMEHPERRVETAVAGEALVTADQRLMRAVLENLLGNAWKYTGKVAEPRIEFGFRDLDGERVFFVRDNGAGFDAGNAARLFQPFCRLHKDKEFSGTGIGLATVQRIIQRHGGKVWAMGEPGKGATFFFTVA